MPAKVAKHFTVGLQFQRFQQNPKAKAPKTLALLAPNCLKTPFLAVTMQNFAT